MLQGGAPMGIRRASRCSGCVTTVVGEVHIAIGRVARIFCRSARSITVGKRRGLMGTRCSQMGGHKMTDGISACIRLGASVLRLLKGFIGGAASLGFGGGLV